MFWSLGIRLNDFFYSPEIRNIIASFIEKFDDSFKYKLRDNVTNNLTNVLILLSTSPGASCNSIGVRSGASLRKMFDIQFN